MVTALSLLEAMALVFALSMDAFAASFAYGSEHIHISYSSLFMISFICSAFLAISLSIGYITRAFIPVSLIHQISFMLLFTLGTFKLFDSSIKRFIKKHQKLHHQVTFSIFQLQIFLQVYADPKIADYDCSRTLNIKEATLLAISLSVDGLAAGFSAGLTQVNIVFISLFSFFCSVCFIYVGSQLGNYLSITSPKDLSWISGCILILLAFFKLS